MHRQVECVAENIICHANRTLIEKMKKTLENSKLIVTFVRLWSLYTVLRALLVFDVLVKFHFLSVSFSLQEDVAAERRKQAVVEQVMVDQLSR